MVTTYLLAEGLADYAFQSTSPQGGRLVVENFLSSNRDFNPRPHKGDDGAELKERALNLQFPSTSPQGGRLAQAPPLRFSLAISIHVPTRGTTISFRFRKLLLKYFNPRPHKGDDGCRRKGTGEIQRISIHVPTRGTTRIAIGGKSGNSDFNPRPPKGDHA